MANTLFGFTPSNAQASGSSFNVKRKARSFSFDSDSNRETQLRRVQSPPFERRSTCPYPQPDLVPDNSASVSDAESAPILDVDMDMDMDMGEGQQEQGEGREGGGMSGGYSFGNSGSGGFGFGPGAEEDEEELMAAEYKATQYPQNDLYPSLTPHPNPHHFTNQTRNGFARSSSPLNAQAFSATLRSPPASGLYQPMAAQPLGANASEIEKARSQHGPQCKSIPKLQLSQYPDPQTGKHSMWTWCTDCGTVEKTQ